MDMLVDMIDPRQRDEMVLAARLRIVLGQLDHIPALQTVNGANVPAIGTEHLHVFLDHHWCNHLILHRLAKIIRGDGPRFLEQYIRDHDTIEDRDRRHASRPLTHPASAAKMRAQLRVPLWNEVRSNFSFGECTRSSSSAKPTMIVSMPS